MHEYLSLYYFIQTGLFYFNHSITSFRKDSESIESELNKILLIVCKIKKMYRAAHEGSHIII